MVRSTAMEATLRRLAIDRRAGAAELFWLGWTVLWCFANDSQDTALRGWKARLRALAERVADAQPAMGPLLRLANDALLAAGGVRSVSGGRKALRDYLRVVRGAQRAAPVRVASALAKELRDAGRVVTHSRSSTVLAGLIRRSRRPPFEVVCCEARPGGEGVETARCLVRAGATVTLVCDAAGPLFVGSADAVVVGADAVAAQGVLNKTGTLALGLAAQRLGTPMWAVADQLKLVPGALTGRLHLRSGPPVEVLGRALRGVKVSNPYFEWTPWDLVDGVVTECGPRSPAQVRRQLGRLRVSGALRARRS